MKNEGGRRRRRVTYTERRLERPRARTNPMVWFSAPAKPFPITTTRRIAPSNISGIASFQFEKKKKERRSCRSISIAWHLFSFFFSSTYTVTMAQAHCFKWRPGPDRPNVKRFLFYFAEPSHRQTAPWRVSKMWASAEGGVPEVTLETSMGSFTVEVFFSFPFFSNTLLDESSISIWGFLFYFIFNFLVYSCTTSTHLELVGTSLNCLAGVITTTLNSTGSSRYPDLFPFSLFLVYDKKNWIILLHR